MDASKKTASETEHRSSKPAVFNSATSVGPSGPSPARLRQDHFVLASAEANETTTDNGGTGHC